jgi:hypothetical protein
MCAIKLHTLMCMTNTQLKAQLLVLVHQDQVSYKNKMQYKQPYTVFYRARTRYMAVNISSLKLELSSAMQARNKFVSNAHESQYA